MNADLSLNVLPRRCRTDGFTLVELLVVISIIGLLMALLLPVLSNSRVTAQATQAATGGRQIGLAMFQYADDNRGSMAFSRFRLATQSTGIASPIGESYAARLYKIGYVDSPRIFWGPARDTRRITWSLVIQNPAPFPDGVFQLASPGYGLNTHFLPQEMLTPNIAFRLGSTSFRASAASTALRVPTPERVMMLNEYWRFTTYISTLANEGIDGNWSSVRNNNVVPPFGTVVDGRPFTYPELNHANVITYLDGHGGIYDSRILGWQPSGVREGTWLGGSNVTGTPFYLNSPWGN